MASITYKVVPVLLYDVIRESEEGDDLTVLPVARCPSLSIAKAAAWALTESERKEDDDDEVLDPVTEEKH